MKLPALPSIPGSLLHTIGLYAALGLGGWFYVHAMKVSAMKDQHAADRIASLTATIETQAHRVDSLKARTPKAETLYVATKAKADLRATKTTDDAQSAQLAAKASGDSATIKAVSTLTMDLVLERRERGQEREAADSLILLYKDQTVALTAELAAVESRANAQHTMDHRAVLRERARGVVTIASAAGGAALGAVFGGPPGAAIGAAVGGLVSFVVGR